MFRALRRAAVARPATSRRGRRARALLAGVRDVPVWISDDPAQAGDAGARRGSRRRAAPARCRSRSRSTSRAPPSARAQVRALADAVRAAGGGPATLSVRGDRRAATPSYGDAIDLYISPLAAHLAGDRVARWTYNGAPPRAGSMVLDAEAPGMRTWGWIAWRWQIPIWYVWDALYWHDRHNRKGAPLPRPRARRAARRGQLRRRRGSRQPRRRARAARRLPSRRCGSPRCAAATRIARCSSSPRRCDRPAADAARRRAGAARARRCRRSDRRRGRPTRRRGKPRAGSCSSSRPARPADRPAAPPGPVDARRGAPRSRQPARLRSTRELLAVFEQDGAGDLARAELIDRPAQIAGGRAPRAQREHHAVGGVGHEVDVGRAEHRRRVDDDVVVAGERAGAPSRSRTPGRRAAGSSRCAG